LFNDTSSTGKVIQLPKNKIPVQVTLSKHAEGNVQGGFEGNVIEVA